jgi:hypothetical protein
LASRECADGLALLLSGGQKRKRWPLQIAGAFLSLGWCSSVSGELAKGGVGHHQRSALDFDRGLSQIEQFPAGGEEAELHGLAKQGWDAWSRQSGKGNSVELPIEGDKQGLHPGHGRGQGIHHLLAYMLPELFCIGEPFKHGQYVTQNALTQTSCDQASIYARFAQRIWSLERAMLR